MRIVTFITIILLIIFRSTFHLDATELSEALKEGERLGWNHKDTYRPYPILFIHGIGGHCTGWNDPDNSTSDLSPDPDDGMISKLLPYFEPYWKTKPEDEIFSPYLKEITLSNGKKAKVYDKTYLETVEFSDNDGSIEKQTQELWHRITGAKEAKRKPCDAHNYTIGRDVEGFKPLLQEYYPFRRDEITNIYEFQPEDKVILVGHSNGGKNQMSKSK